jgi:hypothetical protein
MNDTPTFSPFATQPPPTTFDPADAGQAPTRKKRVAKINKITGKPAKETRRTKAGAIREYGAVADPPVPTRKRARVTRSPKFELGALQAFAGLKAEDAKLLTNLVAGLSTVNKKSRAKIVAALAKVFA